MFKNKPLVIVLVLVCVVIAGIALAATSGIFSGVSNNSNNPDNTSSEYVVPDDVPEVFCPIFSCRDMVQLGDSDGTNIAIGFSELEQGTIINAMKNGTFQHNKDEGTSIIELTDSENKYIFTYEFVDESSVRSAASGDVVKGEKIGIYSGIKFTSDIDGNDYSLVVTVKDVNSGVSRIINYDSEKRVISVVE